MTKTAPDRRERFLQALAKEHDRTMRVLRAYPPDRLDVKPDVKGPTAADTAWKLYLGETLMVKALTTGFDWSRPSGGPPKPPASMAEIADGVDKEYHRVVETVRSLEDHHLDETVQFFVAPKTLGDYAKIDFLWFILFDHVHHRGQLSVYLRLANARVPSIYGPSGDEPWR